MTVKRRSCVNNPDIFCCICGEYTKKEHCFIVQDFTKQAYQTYFGLKLGNQDKRYVPHKVFKSSTETLCFWTHG